MMILRCFLMSTILTASWFAVSQDSAEKIERAPDADSKGIEWVQIIDFEMRAGDFATIPGNLVVQKHWATHLRDGRRVLVEYPLHPEGRGLRLVTANQSNVSIVIMNPDGNVNRVIGLNQTKKIELGGYRYLITCTEIDNGSGGKLDWARFRIVTQQKQE